MDVMKTLAVVWMLLVLCVLVYFGFAIPALGSLLLFVVAFMATIGAVVKVVHG